MNTYKFHVDGMHCNACVVLTESELGELPGVSRVKASLKDLSVEIEGDFGGKAPEDVARELTVPLRPHGYALSVEKRAHSANWRDFWVALPAALGFVVLFVVLQKLGIVNLIDASSINYGTVFVIGLVASVSSCMAVVGGLVLSMSANFAKEGDRIKPQALFHIGRLASFFLLGGAIGALGSAFQLGGMGTFILSLLVGLVMLLLGVNLLDVFPWAKKLQPTMPSFVGRRVHGLKNVNHTLTPLLVGVATFFLPCGFTQSMQIQALATGSFWAGGMTMLVFAAGTLPVLALLSFSSLSIHNNKNSGVFFKAAGLIVIFFALFNILNGLVAAGLIPPLFSF